MRNIVLTGTVSVTIGLLLGYGFFGGAANPPQLPPPVRQPAVRAEPVAPVTPPLPQPDAAPVINAESEALIASLRQQLAQLTRENRSLRAGIAAAQPPAAADPAKALIPKDLLSNIHIEAIGKDYSVGPKVVEALDLTASEKERIEDALHKARGQLDELDIKHGTVVAQSENAVEILIEPFGEDGASIKQELTGDMRDILGDERLDVFMKLARWSFDQRFSHFGQAKRNVTIAAQQGGGMRIDTKSEIKTPTSMQSMSQSERYAGKTEIPENYRHFFEAE